MRIAKIIESGILELHVLGELSPMESEALKADILKYPELQDEINDIEFALEQYALLHATEADPTVAPLLLTTLNYEQRLANGEIPEVAPTLSANSQIIDFQQWIDRPYMQEPDQYDSMAGKIITANEEKTTMIVWLKEGAPPEIHTHEIEKFLIVEGTCDITIGDNTHSLKAGDYLDIPLHISHHVQVTSPQRCKIILERYAA